MIRFLNSLEEGSSGPRLAYIWRPFEPVDFVPSHMQALVSRTDEKDIVLVIMY